MRLEDDPQTRVQTACLLVLVAVCITFSVYWLRPVLVPLVVAFFVVSGISPVLSVLEKRLGVTRIVAAGLTFLAGVVTLCRDDSMGFGDPLCTGVIESLNESR